MPFDLDDAEDKLPATTTTTTASDLADDGDDYDDCDGGGSAKRQRLDITVPERYGSPDDEAVNKVNSAKHILRVVIVVTKRKLPQHSQTFSPSTDWPAAQFWTENRTKY